MTSTQRSITTASYIFVARIIGLVANLAVVFLVTRYLGKELFGHYAFVMGYCIIMRALGNGGTYNILIRETAKDLAQAGKNLGTALQLQMVSILATSILAVLAISLFTHNAVVIQATYITILASVFQTVGNLYASVFTAFEDTRYMAISVFIERTVFLAGVIAMVLLHWGFMSIFWLQVLSFFLKLLFCVLVVQAKFARTTFHLEWARLRYFFHESLPLLASTGFRSLDEQLDTILLQLLQTAAQIGLYGAPYRIVSRLNIVPDSIMVGLLPGLTNLLRAPAGREKVARLYGKMFKYFVSLSLPIAVLGSLLGRPLMVLLFGVDYEDGGAILSIMGWVIVFMFLNYMFKYILTSLGQQKYETVSLALSLAIHLALGMWLIPTTGAKGAAAAMLTAQVIGFVLGYFYVTRYLGAYCPWRVLPRLAAGALAMVAVVWSWPAGPIVLVSLAAGCAYLLVLVLTGVFERDEIDAIRSAMRTGRGASASAAGEQPSAGSTLP